MKSTTASPSFEYLEKSNFERVVVVGKNGFIGRALIEELLKRGIDSYGVGRDDIDLTSIDAVNFFSRTIKPRDVVVFAAGEVPVKEIKQLNANLTGIENFVEGIKGIDIAQLIYVSSDAVYMDIETPLDEKSIRAPQSLHGLMHLTREAFLQSSSLRNALCIVRPTLIYGAKDPHNGYGPCSFLRLARKNEDIQLFGSGEELRDFIYISDVARLITEIIMKSAVGQLNLASGILNSFAEVARAVLEITKSESKILENPRIGAMPHNGFRPFDISNLKTFMPVYMPIQIIEGLMTMNAELATNNSNLGS
jgi:nucleoside-diphosphate-sugar epimerase